MPKPLTQLTIFLSCPSDLNAEKRIVKSAIDEINPLLRETYGVVLESLTWEKDVVPGVGVDAQDVINAQINNKYDIYLGLFGTRFGSETARAGSGTEEEFNAAIERHRNDPSGVRVLFYFKTSTESVHDIDLLQLQKVMNFRKALQSRGVFYREFSNPDDLLKLVKEHLRLLIRDQWSTSKWNVATITDFRASSARSLPQSTVTEIAEAAKSLMPNFGDANEQDDEPGIVDLIVTGEASLAASNIALQNMAKLAERLSMKLNAKTEKFGLLEEIDVNRYKRFIDEAALDLREYADGLRLEIPAFKSSFGEGLNAFESAINIYIEEKLGNVEALGDVPGQLESLLIGMRSGRGEIRGFRDMIFKIPGFTAQTKRTKKLVAILLDDLAASITLFLDRAEDIQLRLKKALSPIGEIPKNLATQ